MIPHTHNNNINNSHSAANVVVDFNEGGAVTKPPSSLRIDQEREARSSYSTSYCYNTFKINPPFDSAMALTVLVLITALFFMGFFSIYIRRFADENNVDPTRRRRLRNTAAGYLSKSKAVDPAVVGSLPVYVYSSGDVEQGSSVLAGNGADVAECAICLSEFEEREWVKEIPFCEHVFHVECIDTWLSSHVTCPLCRTAEFFPAVEEREEERGSGVGEVQGSGSSSGGERDTCRVVGVRRTSSCSWYGERVTLNRSLSF